MSAPQQEKFDWRNMLPKAFVTALGGILVAWVGFIGNWVVSDLSSERESARLITELQINREQAEIALRKDVFDQAIKAFFLNNLENDGSLNALSKQLLTLELLALNFGDSLSLSPLFIEFHGDLRNARPVKDDERADFDEHKDRLTNRLIGLATRVASSQVSSLSGHGQRKNITITFACAYAALEDKTRCDKKLYEDHTYKWPDDDIYAQLTGQTCSDGRPISADPAQLPEADRRLFESLVRETALLEFQEHQRQLEVHVSNIDHCRQVARVQFFIRETDERDVNREFNLDFFNFPKIDNTRLSGNHRFAIVMDDFILGAQARIELVGLVFPSEYASLRDRPGVREAKGLLESALEDGNE